MNTQCTPAQLEFHGFGRREVVGRLDGGRLTSDGVGMLLRDVDRRLGLMDRIAGCFVDYRYPRKVGHWAAELVAQRVYGIAQGYEDLNDALRGDSLLALMACLGLFDDEASAGETGLFAAFGLRQQPSP